MFSINLIHPDKFKSKSNQTVKATEISEWIYYSKFDILSKAEEIRRITMYSCWNFGDELYEWLQFFLDYIIVLR